MNSVPMPERKLTPDERRLLAAYIAMDERDKRELLHFAETIAAEFPARRPAVMHLVK
jgi:hypothetical protein